MQSFAIPRIEQPPLVGPRLISFSAVDSFCHDDADSHESQIVNHSLSDGSFWLLAQGSPVDSQADYLNLRCT